MTVRQQVCVLIIALPLVVMCACDETSSGYPPVARIGATPRAIPENDAFNTPVVLDASASADPIDDPQATRPLGYRWTIVGDDFRVQDGSLSQSKVTVTFIGDHPATIRLTVTDADGLSSTAQEQLQLTLRQ
jgi:hypothetical protein